MSTHLGPPTGPGSSGRRRGFPWWVLGLGFVAAMFAEVYVIVSVGQTIGALWTILLMIAAGLAGTWLVKREGGRAFRAFNEALQQGRMPHKELADGVLVLVGGVLMITPGFLTDVVGVLMVLPLTRPLGRSVLAGVLARRLTSAYAGPGAGFGFPPGFATPQQRQAPRDADDVVQGEVVDPPPQQH